MAIALKGAPKFLGVIRNSVNGDRICVSGGNCIATPSIFSGATVSLRDGRLGLVEKIEFEFVRLLIFNKKGFYTIEWDNINSIIENIEVPLKKTNKGITYFDIPESYNDFDVNDKSFVGSIVQLDSNIGIVVEEHLVSTDHTSRYTVNILGENYSAGIGNQTTLTLDELLAVRVKVTNVVVMKDFCNCSLVVDLTDKSVIEKK